MEKLYGELIMCIIIGFSAQIFQADFNCSLFSIQLALFDLYLTYSQTVSK